jgi:hypothetical protein
MSRLNPFAVLLVICGLAATAARGDTITYGQLAITSPGLAFSASDNVVVSNATSALYPGYTFSAEFCENSACSSPIASSSDSLLRFTDMTLTCASAEGCGLIDIRFQATNAMLDDSPSPAGTATVDLGLDGTATEAVVGSATICITGPHAICAPDLSGTHSFSTSFDGAFSASTNGAVPVSSGFSVYGQIEIFHLDNGNSVSLANSLDIDADIEPALGAEPVPEPGTLALTVPPLLLLLGVGLRKSRKLRSIA